MFDRNDILMMENALSLARQGRFSTSPNPRVGCVITRGSQIVGQGFHIQAGGPHAEVHALRQAGGLAEGATAYVTLEPCSHYGRTPPCAEALVHSGVKRVVAAMTDPNPLVSGKGLAMLEAAGIQTESGLLEQQARELNRGFLSRIERNRPFVRLKCAASMDGKTALSDGLSQWITGEEARLDVQTLRAESCAVITGIGTVLADNPKLNVRAFPTLRQPARIIVDSRLRTPEHCHLIQDNTSPTIIATANPEEGRLKKFARYNHVDIIQTNAHNGQVDLSDLLRLLAERGFGEVMVEAGAGLAGAFLYQDLADEIVLYQAPKILGNNARGLFALPENPQTLLQPPQWQTHSLETVGSDIKWTLRRQAADS